MMTVEIPATLGLIGPKTAATEKMAEETTPVEETTGVVETTPVEETTGVEEMMVVVETTGGIGSRLS